MRTLIRALAVITLVVGIMTATSALAEEATTASPLFDRLGGLKGITLVVDDFIDRLVINETLNQNPAIDAGRKASPAPYLKFQVSQMVCAVTGGPCKYTGMAMKESHAHLNISEQEWSVMVGEFQKTLDKFNVPAAEQKELFAIVNTTHDDIVTRK